MLTYWLSRARNERAALGYVTDTTRIMLTRLGVTSPEMETYFSRIGG